MLKKFEADWQQRSRFFLGAFDRLTNEFVAQIYIGVVSQDLPEFELGYFVEAGHEDRGYIVEAAIAALQLIFDDLQASRVRLECDDTNLRSRRVAERCGFVQEGQIRQNKKNADGTFTGTLFFGMLRNEYEILKNDRWGKDKVKR